MQKIKLSNLKSNSVNLLLIAVSSIFGLLVVNFGLIFYISNARQLNSFPRGFLRYIPPLSRWIYPDLNDHKVKELVLLIGDSYVEGAGDAFLNWEYNYSVGHFLSILRNNKFKLAANGGSYLPYQIKLLEESFNRLFTPLGNNYELSKKLSSINTIMFFYEGNDLDKTILRFNKENKRDLTKRAKTGSFIRAYVPLIYFFKVLWRDNIKITFNNILSKIYNQKNENFDFSNNLQLYKSNKICRRSICRELPPMQAASTELTKTEVDYALKINIDSIINFKKKYETNLCLVYIPSPVTLYSPGFFYRQPYLSDFSQRIQSSLNDKRSKYIRTKLKFNLEREEIFFYDSTDFMKNLADEDFIHGEKDPKHFNKYGYKKLAEFIDSKAVKCFK